MNEPTQPRKQHSGEHLTPKPVLAISSTDLLRGQRELQIQHAGDIYRLRITKSGKLILTK